MLLLLLKTLILSSCSRDKTSLDSIRVRTNNTLYDSLAGGLRISYRTGNLVSYDTQAAAAFAMYIQYDTVYDPRLHGVEVEDMVFAN